MTEGERFLHSIYYEQKELMQLLQFREERRLSTLPGSLAPRKVRVQTSRKADPLGDAVSAVVDISGTIETLTEHLRKHKQEAMELIFRIDDSRYRMLLLLRYLNVKSDGRRPDWGEIADMMGYSYRHTTKTHRLALEAFERVYTSRPGA